MVGEPEFIEKDHGSVVGANLQEADLSESKWPNIDEEDKEEKGKRRRHDGFESRKFGDYGSAKGEGKLDSMVNILIIICLLLGR